MPSTTILIMGLPPGTSEDAVKVIIGQYGMLQSVTLLPPTGKAETACLCEMTSLDEARWIECNLNGNIPQGLSTPVSINFAANFAAGAACASAPSTPALHYSPYGAAGASTGIAAYPNALHSNALGGIAGVGAALTAAAADPNSTANWLAQLNAVTGGADIAAANYAATNAAVANLLRGYGSVVTNAGLLGGLGTDFVGYGAMPRQAQRPALPVTDPTETHLTGTFAHNKGQFGFIKQDNGHADMFCLPQSCEAFGRILPTIGIRVSYNVIKDTKTGRSRAEQVQPLAT